jgi:hypothetical protein
VPLVFRIRNFKLRLRFAAFLDAERRRTGYDVTATAVAERAIRELLERAEGQR